MSDSTNQESSSLSDDVIIITTTLIFDLSSPSSTPLTQLISAAAQLHLLSKTHPGLRPIIARTPGAVPSLVSLLSHSDPLLQEHAVTTILNLSISPPHVPLLLLPPTHDHDDIVTSLVHVLRTGTQSAQANAACAIFHLANTEDRRSLIVAAGAIPGLVRLMERGEARGKKDAMTAMFALCEKSKEHTVRAVEAGAVRVLIGLVEEGEVGVADKAGYMVWKVVGLVEEGRAAVVEEGGIGVMVDMVELGTRREKEIAVGVLLEMCEASPEYCGMVAREGAVPSLIALSESGTIKAKNKVEKLIEMLRNVKLISASREILEVLEYSTHEMIRSGSLTG